MSFEPAIRVTNLAKTYRIYKKPADRLLQGILPGNKRYTEKHALYPLSFSLRKGETLGVVGCNGSGKSTLLQLICGTLTPTQGECVVQGRIAALLELGSGFNPEFTGKENIYLNAALLGLSREETQARYADIVAFSGLGDAVLQPVKTYSSGMYVRLAFAVASAVNPDIFIIDEALAVGDERFQRKCYKRIKELKEQGTTILFVSHSAHSVLDICDRALLLDAGEMLLMGTPKQVIHHYHHLIYAPDDMRQQVRENIKSYQGLCEEDEEDMPVDNVEFIPNMCAETMQSGAPKGAEIKDFCITKEDGTPVNLLMQRGEYNLKFNVVFSKPSEGVRFQYVIQKSSGIVVHSSNTKHCTGLPASVEAGHTYKASFNFKCLLLPGYYYVTFTCYGLAQGENCALHRISDAIMFRVLPNPAIQAGGIVDLMSEPTVEYMGELC